MGDSALGLSMSRSRQIAINAASQWCLTILSAALGLVLVPLLIAKLGKGGYGLIAIAMATASVCTLADLGISGALGRQLAEALARNDNRKYRELLSTAAGLNLLMGLTCALTVFLLAPQLARFFALPDLLFDTGVFILKSYCAAHVLITFLMPTARAVLASHNRFDTTSQIDAARRLFETAGLFLVLADPRAGIAGWAVVCVTTDMFCTVLLWRAAAKTHKGFGLGVSLIRLSSVRELFSLGSKFTLLQLSGQLSVNADPFILTACLGPASVSLYRPSAQVLAAVAPFVSTLTNQLDPLATKAHVEGRKKDLTAILFRGTKYTMLMGAALCAMVISLAYPLCHIWLGAVLGEQYKVCALVLVLQSVTQFGAFAAGTQWPVLLGMNQTAFAAYGRLAFAVLNVICSWLLVRYTSLGVLGVVIPTMVIEIIWRPVLIHHVCRILGVSVRQYVRRSYLSSLLVASGVTAMGFVLRWLVPPGNLWTFSASATAMALTAAGLIWFWGFNQADRDTVLGAVCRREVGMLPDLPAR